jgi:hypothetical protein
MRRTSMLPRIVRTAVFVCAVSASLRAAAAVHTEEEPVVDAASLVEPALLSGPGFSVDPHVELRGYMAHFKLDTRFGSFDAPSVEILAEREAELPALELLDAATHSEAFTRAAGDRFASTGKSLARIVMHPVDTITGIPSGVARFLRDKLVKLGNQAQTLSDRAARKLGSSGNPYPSDDGPMTDARAGDAEDAPPKKRKNWFTRVTSEGERFVKREIKYNTIKREIAKRLGIDPYSSNPYVQERLSSLAWVGTAGNFSAGSALGAVGGIGAEVLSKGGRIDEVVWRLSPDDLRAQRDAPARALPRQPARAPIPASRRVLSDVADRACRRARCVATERRLRPVPRTRDHRTERAGSALHRQWARPRAHIPGRA